MKIEDFFKEAFYINLDSRPDRKEMFENEIKKCGLEPFFKRYPGCLPKIDDVGDDNSLLGYRKHGACGRSHRNLVQYAKDKDLDNILIFEDDIAFYDEGVQKAMDIIENALDTLSNVADWDIVYFGGIIIDREINQPINNLLKVDKILTAHAWGINKKCYDTILKYKPNDGYSKDYDCPIDGDVGNNTNLNKYLAYPLAIYQRSNVVSDCAIRSDGVPALSVDVFPWLQNYDKKIKE
jgi:hypothetical protein